MQNPTPKLAVRYLASLTGVTLACLALVFAFNALVDPLWYFSGNQFKPINFAFNERLSKVNLISGHEKDYDCIIFGDSRATLLPEDKVKGYHCFNFAFSAGSINEFVSYAHWLKARGLNPRLVIVGVSAGDFRPRKAPQNVPEFISENSEPTPAIIKYLSTDVVTMSWRTLFGSSPIDRFYNSRFQCRVAIKTRYDPLKPIRDQRAGPFNNHAPLKQYSALRSIFPDAEFIGYTPPISAYAILDYEKTGWLASYTGALSAAANIFDKFLDASIPSPITVDPTNTYDGTHYSSTVNARIAAGLLDNHVPHAIDLKHMTVSEVLSTYRHRLARYHDEMLAQLN